MSIFAELAMQLKHARHAIAGPTWTISLWKHGMAAPKIFCCVDDGCKNYELNKLISLIVTSETVTKHGCHCSNEHTSILAKKLTDGRRQLRFPRHPRALRRLIKRDSMHSLFMIQGWSPQYSLDFWLVGSSTLLLCPDNRKTTLAAPPRIVAAPLSLFVNCMTRT